MTKLTAIAALLLSLGASLAPADTLPASPPPDRDGPVVVFVSQRLFREEVLELVRARLLRSGCEVLIAAPDTLVAVGMDRTIIRPDLRLEDIDPAAVRALVLVGGSGIIRHWADSTLMGLCRTLAGQGRLVAGIGLANVCLARAGLLQGRRATVFANRDAIAELKAGGARYRPDPVVTDGPLVTALDASAARPFALALAARLERGRP
jgi:protease I